jgi:hypothetical protein
MSKKGSLPFEQTSLIFLVLLVPEIRMADRQKRPRLLVPVQVGMEM